MTSRRLHTATRLALLTIVCVLLTRHSTAFAFTAVEYFGWTPARAGGDGRYFTGSAADGYTCKVCHAGGPEPELHVLGLPLAGYQPDTHYEFIVDWPDSLEHLSAMVEVTDMNGARAGMLRVPPPEELRDSEYCRPPVDGDSQPSPAANLVLVPVKGASADHCAGDALPDDCRQVVDVPDCGAGRLRFLWTAPSADVGPVWFAGSAVASDHQGDAEGDGVSDFGHVIASQSSTKAAAFSVQGNCSALPLQRRSGLLDWLVGAMLAGSCWLRATRRRR